MRDNLIHLEPEVEIFFTYPFLLGLDIVPMGGDWRKETIPKLAEELNSTIQEYRWSFANIEEDKTLPEPIRESKKLLLKGSPRKRDRLILSIKKLAKNEVIPFMDFDLLDVNETIWYYDWGAGTIDLVFKIRIQNETGTDHLLALTEKLAECTDLPSEKQDDSSTLEFVDGWEQNSKAFLELLRQRSENEAPTPNQKFSDDKTVDVPGHYHPALIMQKSSEGGLVLSEEQFRVLLKSFSGKESAEWKYSTSLQDYGIDTCVDGFNGSVAVLNHNCRGGMDSLAEKIKWNYRLAFLYSVRLRLFVDGLANCTFQSLNSGKRNSLEDVNWVRDKKLELQLFLDEMSPTTVAVDDVINHHIYSAVANAQEVDDIVKKIESQLSYLERYYSDSISMKSNSLEMKPEIYRINEVRGAVDQILTLAKELPYQRVKPKMVLTEKQGLDYKKFEYRCRDKVYIPGTLPLKRSNIIMANENNIKLGDRLFALFLRFVVELKKEKGGWVNIHTLESEGIIQSEDIQKPTYQIYSRLRSTLQGSLSDKDGQKFIQSDGIKNYRISTHPEFITYASFRR